MLQPKPKFDPNKPFSESDGHKPKFDPNADFEEVKKKSLSSISKNPELASETTTGSLVGKNSNGFPKIDTNSIAPNYDEMKPAAENPVGKAKRLQKELSNVKVTPKNQDEVLAKTDELSAVIKQNEEAKKAKPKDDVESLGGGLLNRLYTGMATVSKSFYDAPKMLLDAIYAPQNILADKLNIPSLRVDPEKYAFENIPSKNMDKIIEGNNKKIENYKKEIGGDIVSAYDKGDYGNMLKHSFLNSMESVPLIAATMATGGESALANAVMIGSSASTQYDQLNKEHPEMSTNAKLANSAVNGALEVMVGKFMEGVGGNVWKNMINDKGVKATTEIAKNSFKKSLEKLVGESPIVGVGANYFEERLTDAFQQYDDIATGASTEFDWNKNQNAGLSSLGFGLSNATALYATKAYISNKIRKQVKESSKQILNLQSELQNPNLSPENRKLITDNINQIYNENKSLLGTELEKLKTIPEDERKELVSLDKSMEKHQSDAVDIKHDNSISDESKEILLANLKKDFKKDQDRKNEILTKTTGVDTLPLKDQEKLKKQALEDLVTELNPDGTKDITITNEQVVERANKIYAESKANNNPAAVNNNPIPPAPEDYNIVDPPTQNAPQQAEAEKVENLKEGKYEYNGKTYNYDGSSLTDESGAMYPLSSEKNSLLEKIKNDGVFVEEIKTPKEFNFSEEEKTNVQKKVVEEPRVILRRGNVGADAFFALPNEGVFGEVVDKVGTDENVTAYQYPKDFKIKDLSNEVVFDDYMSNKMFEYTKKEGYDAAYVMEIDGSKVLHVVNPEKLTLLDEKLPELRNNEAVQKPNPTTDGNIRPGTDPNVAPGQNENAQPPTKPKTNKGEVGTKLQEINKNTFGLDDKQSKANAVIMEKTIETMAKRAGISKEEMFDKIDFEKGDSKTIEKLSKKGKALFQIFGKNAKLTPEENNIRKTALQMAKEGISAKEIFKATGWEKGIDGKWKSEMLEGNVKFKKFTTGLLGNILDHKELFQKYPKSKDIRVIVNDRLNGYGMFNSESNTIFLNPKYGQETAKSTLLHEIQHWIQRQEGFSKGGSAKTARQALENKIKTETNFSLKKALTKFKNLIYSEKIDQNKLDNELSKFKDLLGKKDFDLYESIAGEVEARNVEGRMNMTPEQRRNTPLSETEKNYKGEKISRDEQIVLFQGEQGAMLAEDGKFIIYALEDPNVSTPLHELAHVYEHYLTESERNTILEDAGHDSWTRETSEHFARGFEKYLADGIAPNPEMKSLFEDFKKWLTDIYNGIKDSEIDIKISPAMQKVYDEMLGATLNKDKTITVGDYTYEYSNNEWVAKNKDGKVDKKKEIPKKVLDTHADNFDFTKGETALEAQKINDVSTWEEDVAEHSNNPVEVAKTLLNAQTMDATEGLDTKSKHIAETIGGKGVERSSFSQRAGKKGMKDIPGSLAIQYFSKKGKGSGLDIIAQNAEIAMYGDWDSQNPRITEDDVFDFINDNPRGTNYFLNSAKKEKINALKTAFTDLTGLPATDKYIGKAMDQAAEQKFRFENEEVLYQYSNEDLISLSNEYDNFIKYENGKQEKTNEIDRSGTTGHDTENKKSSNEESGIQETRGSESGPEKGNDGITREEKTSINEELDNLEKEFKKVNDSLKDYVAAGKTPTNDRQINSLEKQKTVLKEKITSVRKVLGEELRDIKNQFKDITSAIRKESNLTKKEALEKQKTVLQTRTNEIKSSLNSKLKASKTEIKDLHKELKRVANHAYSFGFGDGTIAGEIQGTKKGILEGAKRTKETAVKIAETLKIYTEKGVLTARQASTLTQKALKTNFNSPIQVAKYLDYAYKVIRNADYKDMLSTANTFKKSIKKALGSKTFPKSATTIDVVKSFLKIDPRSVDDINEYNSIATSIKNNLKGVKVAKDGTVSNESLETSNNAIRIYVNEQLKIQEEKAKQQLLTDYQNFVDSGVIDPKQMSLQEMQTIVAAIEKGDEAFDDYTNDLNAEELAKKENTVRQIVNSQITALDDHLKEQRVVLGDGTMESVLTETEKNIVKQIQTIDTATLSLKELVKLNDVLNNITQNSDFSGSGDMAILSEYQKDKSKLASIVSRSGIELGKLKKNISEIASLNQLPEFISKSVKVAAEIQRLTGISDVINGHAVAKIGYNKVLNQYDELKKSFGKDADSPENRYRRGVYSRIIQHLGGTEIDQLAEFVRIKNWVKQTGERLSALDQKEFPKEAKEGELVNRIYDELLKDSNTVAEVKAKLEKIEPKNIKLVDFWVDAHDKKAEQLFENSEVFSNKSLEKVANYTATSVKGLGGKSFIETGKERDIFESNFFNKKIDNKEAGAKNNRTKAVKLPENSALDLDFDNVQSKKFYEAVYDIETSKAIAKVRKVFSDPEMAQILGGVSNSRIVENAVRQSILAQKNKLPIPANLEGKIVKTLSAFQAKGARMALGSVTQLPKQYVSVAFNTLVNLGANSPLFFKALSIGNDLEIFDKVNVGLRGETKAGLNRDLNFNEIDKINFGGNLEKGLSKVNEVGLKVSEGIMKALETSDVAVARTSWLAYYMQDLKKQGVDIESIDWTKEHENINEEAAAYAEQQVSRNQNPNDVSSGAVAFKDRGYGQIVKNVYLPFSTFAINQRVRMTNDVQKLVYGGEKGEALKSLGATFVEQAVFNLIKILALAPLASTIGGSIVGAFGYHDDDDPYKNAGKKFGANLFSDFFFSGMGTLPQDGMQHVSNQITKAALKKEFFYNYDPTKFGQPEFIKYLGIYGTALGAANTVIQDSKFIDGKATKVTTGGFETKVETTESKMTDKETQLAQAIFMIDFMNLVGVSDAFLNQVNGQVKKGFKKHMEKEYGGKKVVIVTKGKK